MPFRPATVSITSSPQRVRRLYRGQRGEELKSPTTTRRLFGSASHASTTRRCSVRCAHVRQGGCRNGLLKWTFMTSRLWSRTLQCDGSSTAACALQYGSGTVRTPPFRRIAMPMPVCPTAGSRCPCGSTVATASAVSGVSSCRAAISTSLRTRSSANAALLARPPQRLADRILTGRRAVLFKGLHWRVESTAGYRGQESSWAMRPQFRREVDLSRGRLQIVRSETLVDGGVTVTRVVTESRWDGNREIYVVDVAGSNVTRLANNAVWDGFAAWSPTP